MPLTGIGDLNGNPADVFTGFNTFTNSNEYFTHVEVGITSNKDYMLLDNIHVSYWHRDASVAQATPEGWGLVFSATKGLKTSTVKEDVQRSLEKFLFGVWLV